MSAEEIARDIAVAAISNVEHQVHIFGKLPVGEAKEMGSKYGEFYAAILSKVREAIKS